MQKIFAEGMINELNLSKDMVARIFPCLDGLLDLHLNFFHKLKERQLQSTLVENIGDIVLQQVECHLANYNCMHFTNISFFSF
jgi:rho-guanine nucleotide exchange factor